MRGPAPTRRASALLAGVSVLCVLLGLGPAGPASFAAADPMVDIVGIGDPRAPAVVGWSGECVVDCDAAYLTTSPEYATFVADRLVWQFHAVPEQPTSTYRLVTNPGLPAEAVEVVYDPGTRLGHVTIDRSHVTADTYYFLTLQEVDVLGEVVERSFFSFDSTPTAPRRALEVRDAAGKVVDLFGDGATGTLTAGESYTLDWSSDGWAPGTRFWNALNSGGPGAAMTLEAGGPGDSTWTRFTVPLDLAGSQAKLELAARHLEFMTHWFRTGWVDVLPARLDLSAATIKGTARVGQTVRATGAESSADPDLSHQWRRNGKAITGAVGETYRLTRADAGRKVNVAVTGTQDWYADQTVISKAIAVAAHNTKRPAVNGTMRVGQRLRASRGSWLAPDHRFSYRWLRNGKVIRGATTAAYRLVRADRGKQIRVRVIARRGGFPTVTMHSPARAVRR